jgi:transposase
LSVPSVGPDSTFAWRSFRGSRQGVTAATLTGWHDAFLAAGEAALTTRAATGEELASDRLQARLGAALIERDLLNEKIAILEAGRPFARRRRAP